MRALFLASRWPPSHVSSLTERERILVSSSGNNANSIIVVFPSSPHLNLTTSIWDFFGRNDAKAETPVLWPPHAKSWLIGKDSDAGRDWGQEGKGTTEDEMAGWHHWLGGRESQWTPGVGDGQGGLACCNSWGRKESNMTERLNWTEWSHNLIKPHWRLYLQHIIFGEIHSVSYWGAHRFLANWKLGILLAGNWKWLEIKSLTFISWYFIEKQKVGGMFSLWSKS